MRLAVLLGVVLAGLAVSAPAAGALPLLGPLHAVPGTSTTPGRVVDGAGRQVLVRGVNVNSLGDYWRGTGRAPTQPFTARDAFDISSFGWNAVRLVVSWSSIEPAPGRYDAAYLRRVRAAVRMLAHEGVATIVDMHQDAWGASLAAPPGTACPAGSEPAIGWDGAPAWATLAGSAGRCVPAHTREASPAVLAAWSAFWADGRGLDGRDTLGVQERFARMWRHVAQTLGRERGVSAFDVLNEPGALGDAQNAALGRLYARVLPAIRAGERAGRAARHLVLVEPSVLWSVTASGPPAPFAHDRDVAYAPHLYTGVFGGGGPPQESAFATADREAAALGGLPVITGEWGADPSRAGGTERYFERHLALQDAHRIGGLLWLWKTSCGDPHQVWNLRTGSDPGIWGPFTTDCVTNATAPRAGPLRDELRRGYAQAAPGRLLATTFDAASGRLRITGRGGRGRDLQAWYPASRYRGGMKVLGRRGLGTVHITGRPGGVILWARARGGAWSLTVGP